MMGWSDFLRAFTPAAAPEVQTSLAQKPVPPKPPSASSAMGIPTFSAIREGNAAWLKARGVKTRVTVRANVRGETHEGLEQMDLHTFMVLAFDADEAGQAFQGSITIKGTKFNFNAAGAGIKFTRGT